MNRRFQDWLDALVHTLNPLSENRMTVPTFGPHSSDEDLAQEARTAPTQPEREQAATVLLKRYRSRVFAWCRRYQPDREAALDLTQEVLIRTYRGLASYEGRSLFSSWIFAVTRNECLKSLRGSDRPMPEDLDPDLLPGSAADPERQLLDRLAEQDMLALISATLTPLEQKALWMRCFDRLSVVSITDLLGIEDRSGARAVLQKARRKLRAALDANRRKEG